ncbi:MAG: ATP-binding cassette domain-containing protein [Bacteroidales bacterium]|nr:ATP-binding cassette domain-containing protein [Bacteroidales bacterium]
MILEAKHIYKSYANHKALNDVSISVPRGSVFGLLGPNGAGKTTLIRNINQITAPDSGEILFDGERLQPKHIEQIGYLPEERGLYKKMKVGEQAMYLAQLKGLSEKEAMTKLKEWFVKFSIETWWDKKVEELSKGMAQKVQFIVTILHNPKLLIFDEPFSGFDPVNVELLKAEMMKLRDNGTTIIFSTHNMASVEELCDNIALINNSQVVLSGNMKEIQRRYRNHTYSLTYENEQEVNLQPYLQQGFSVLSSQSNGHGFFTAKIQIPTDSKINHLLAEITNHVDITGIQEILPSMNDIFIQTVTK